jgi:hypothetical protein
MHSEFDLPAWGATLATAYHSFEKGFTQLDRWSNRLTRIGRYIFWISKTTLIGAILDLILGAVEERTGKRNTTKYGSNEMNMKEIRGNDQEIETPSLYYVDAVVRTRTATALSPLCSTRQTRIFSLQVASWVSNGVPTLEALQPRLMLTSWVMRGCEGL